MNNAIQNLDARFHNASEIIKNEYSLQCEKEKIGEAINVRMEKFINSVIEKNNEIMGCDYYSVVPGGAEEKALLKGSRKGFCGQCSEEALDFLSENGIHGFSKVNPSGGHYFLINEDSGEIIEPTYKQMFFKNDLSLGEINDRVRLLDEYPSVFFGSKNDFDEVIDELCKKTNSSKPDLHANWRVN